jgi:hypothetical protein
LTGALIQEIAARIHAGAFDHVAVESLGVPYDVYQGWLRRGRSRGSRALHRGLVDSVRTARAQGRLMAEMKIRDKDPKVWLLQGPGRDTAGQPGWGNDSKVDSEAVPQVLWNLCDAMLDALGDMPEARTRVAEVADRLEPRSKN